MRRVVLVSLLVAAAAVAGEADRLKEDIASLEFLNRLQLNREQALAMLPLAERGAFLRRDLELERDAMAVRFHDALLRFHEEDLKGEGLSDAVMNEAGGLNHELKLLGARTAAALAPLEEQAAALLNGPQRAIAVPRMDDRHPLDLLRALKGSDYDEVRDNIARRLANARVEQGLAKSHERRELRLRLVDLLDDVKDWPAWDYQARRDDLLRALVPGWERAQVAAEIHRIYLARYGEVGPLAQHLFRERMLAVLAERAGIPAPKLPPPDSGRTVAGDVDEINRKIAELKADINLLNLINGLHLDRTQLAVIRKAARVCELDVPSARRDREAESLPALREAYAALRRAEPVPASTRTKLMSPLQKRGAGYMAARRREQAEARERGTQSLLDVLSPEQGEVIRTYSPCLVPPKNLRDPVRAGQANDTDALEAMVDHLRQLDLSTDPRASAERFVQHIELHDGRLPEAERASRIQLVLDVARQAQGMSEISYLARRAELAARLRPIDRLETLKQRLMELDGEEKVICDKICAFLLDPRIVPLVEDRMTRLAHPTAVTVEVPKAEGCKECGRP